MTGGRFLEKIKIAVPKDKISVLQINLGRKCNLACHHCHVEASPRRTEELSESVKNDILRVIEAFEQIDTVDLTGGAPECHHGFREIVKASREHGKEVVVRSNLVIILEEGFEDLPDFFAEQGVRIVASLPCYIEENVDHQRGRGTYQKSIEAIEILNQKGYGKELILDLVYNPAIPTSSRFSLSPNQESLEKDYKEYLQKQFGINFNSLYTFINLPIGRFSQHLTTLNLEKDYLNFLEANYNDSTLPYLMCRSQLSVDHHGNVYDCDFNQITGLSSTLRDSEEKLTLKTLLREGSLDVINHVKVKDYCFGCTAGSGSSCSGSLI